MEGSCEHHLWIPRLNLTSRIWVLRVRRSFLSYQRGEVPGSEVLCGVVEESESRLTKGGSAFHGGGEEARGGRTLGASAQNTALLQLRHSPQRERERVCVCVCVCVYDWRRHGGPRASPACPPPCQDPHDPCLASPERCPQDASIQEGVGPQNRWVPSS